MKSRPQAKDIPDALIIEACAAFHARTGQTPDVALSDRWPAKVIMAKMAKLHSQGKIDYGVSLRTAWPVRARDYE